MKKMGWIGAIATVMLFAGCSAPSGQGTEAAPPVAVDEPAPALTAEPEAPTAAEDTFVTAIQRMPGFEDAAPEAVIATGEAVCTQLDEGVSPLDIVAIDGDPEVYNDDAIRASVELLCTAHYDATYQAFADEYALNHPQQ